VRGYTIGSRWCDGGCLTVGLTEGAAAGWYAAAATSVFGKQMYFDPSIETGLTPRLALRQSLRQTGGAFRSIAVLLVVSIRVIAGDSSLNRQHVRPPSGMRVEISESRPDGFPASQCRS
jgi:hypothetical protein